MTQEILRREELKRDMRAILEQTLDERVTRYLEVAHQGIFRITTSPRRHLSASTCTGMDTHSAQ